jgi:hypothetical protein
MDDFRQYIKDKIDDIDKKVTIQNGRVGRLEKWQYFTNGLICFIAIIFVPMAVRVMSTLLLDLLKGG